MAYDNELKQKIDEFCAKEGMDIHGYAPVTRWYDDDKVKPGFRPDEVFESAKTVIVAGVSIPLPIVETTPSTLHKETYDSANRVLDNFAFNLTRYLNRLGSPTYFFPRDGYGSLRILYDRPTTGFQHMASAVYAGLGTFGLNNCVLTPEFGPRVRFVSIMTSAEIEPSPMIEDDLCIKCRACELLCPVNAIHIADDLSSMEFDMPACNKRHQELVANKAYPCGICTKVCPVGADRKLYKEKGFVKKYREEPEALQVDPDDPRYQTWTHMRKYGSWTKEYPRNPK